MHFHAFTRRRSAAAIAVATLAIAACDRSDSPVAPIQFRRATTFVLEVSDAGAGVGSQVAVGVSADRAQNVGGVQGFLRFDATKLRYKGQVRGADRQMMLVNDRDAAVGTLRIAAVDPDGLKTAGSLVFDVLSRGYASSLAFEVEEAAANGSTVALMRASVDPAVRVDPTLVAGNARTLSAKDWLSIAADLDGPKAQAFDPGEVRNGLKFGDTNFDNAITLGDAVYLINISVGLNELIAGTDGTGPLGDRDAVMAGNVLPFNAPGVGELGDALAPGVEADGSRNVTLGDAVAVINESVSIDQPVVGEIMPGRPATPPSTRVIVNADVTTNTTWTNGNIYELQGGIRVTSGATLTIQAGTRVEGARGTGPGVGGSALLVQRDGRLVADGTSLQPIIFTCVGEPKSKGCWGGLVIDGNAGLNEGTQDSPIVLGRSAAGGCFQKSGEGNSGQYGGCNDDDDSGILRYVRVEYAGFRFTPENELNGIALQGVGRNTVVDFVQVHAGLDDGIEFFGGTVNVKHLVLTANEDDSFDWVEGFRGKAQFLIIQHDPLDSDKGFEGDNTNTQFDVLPRSTPTIYNVTMVGKPDPTSTAGVANNNSVAGFNIRRGTRPHFFNVYSQNWRAVMDVDDAPTCVDFGTAIGFELKSSIFAANLSLDETSASDTDPTGCNGSEAGVITFASANNQVIAASTLLDPLNFIVPDWRPATGTATGGATPPSDGFFDATATYIGAVPAANATKSNIPWYSGWTRGWQSSATP